MKRFIQEPQEIKENTFEAFIKEFKEYENKLKVKSLRDKFLDAYSTWLKDDSRKNKLKVLRLAIKLNSIDKEFKISSLFKKKALS